jgi:hypothetical protein
MKAEYYIAEGCTLGNMIENYSMTWKVYNMSVVEEDIQIHNFTIIAYPQVKSNDL